MNAEDCAVHREFIDVEGPDGIYYPWVCACTYPDCTTSTCHYQEPHRHGFDCCPCCDPDDGYCVGTCCPDAPCRLRATP